MIKFDWPLAAGESKAWFGTGRYLRILSAKHEVNIETDTGISSEIIAGIGADLARPETGEHFKRVTFKSEQEQTISVIVSAFPTTDSRLSGDVDINGLLTVVNAGGVRREVAKVACVAGANKILPADIDRLKASLYFGAGVDVYLGVDNTVDASSGFLVQGGSDLEDLNTSELWCYVSAPTIVSVIGDYK